MPNSAERTHHEGVIKLLFQSACLRRLWIGAAGVLAGTACAIFTGNLSIWPAILCLMAMLSAQVGINLLRSRLRLKGSAVADELYGHLIKGVPLSTLMLEMAKVSFMITALSFMGLVGMSGLWALVPAAFLVAVVYLYVGSATPLFGSWWEQVCQFMLFGPVAVFFTFFYQALHSWGSFDMVMTDAGPAAFSSVIIGLLGVNASLVGNCFADELNPQKNRDNFAARYGVKGVSWMIQVNGVVFYVIALTLYALYPMPYWIFVAMIPTLSFVLNMIVGFGIRKNTPRRLESMYSLSIFNPFICGVLSLIVLMILREPSHSAFVVFD